MAAVAELKVLHSRFVHVPEALSALLRVHNGRFWLYGFRLLSVEEMVEVADRLGGSNEKWIPESLPFARDVDNNYLILDKEGKVFEWDEEEGEGPAPAATSFASYLEHFRDKLLSGKLEFVDAVGVVECMDSPVKRTGAK